VHAAVYRQGLENKVIPKTIEEVTPAWLSEVLGCKLNGFELTQIGEGIGIMGEIYRVSGLAGSDSALPDSVVVKLPSSFEENRNQGVALGMFEAEVRFYNELAPAVPVGLPEIYRAEITPGTAEFVIVMEDLSRLEMAEQIGGMSAEQAMAAVKVLAAVHAVWWNRAKSPEMEWIPSMVGPRIEFVDQHLLQILPVFLEGFADFLSPGGIELCEMFAGHYLEINTVLAGRSPWTLVHQDYRVENMLFGEGSDVVVIDWQGIGRGPGAYDVAYLLGGSLDPKVRREHESEIVGTYHAALMEQGVTGYCFDQLWEDYAHAHLMGGLATSMVTGGGMDLSNERGRTLIATMASRHVTAALDHDGKARLQEIIG